MKVAEIRYNGRARRHSRRGPSDERYFWQKGARGEPDTSDTTDKVEDALHFEDAEAFEVDWTAIGRIAKLSRELDSPADEIEAMLSDMGYRQKQALAKRLDLNAGGTEEELDERLRPEVERLQEQMETHHD